MTKSRFSRETFLREKGAEGEVPEEGSDVLAFMGMVVAGVLRFLREGFTSRCRRSSVLLVDLVMTLRYADVEVEVEGRLEPLLSLMEVFSFLVLSLLRILFLPMMREEILLL